MNNQPGRQSSLGQAGSRWLSYGQMALPYAFAGDRLRIGTTWLPRQ